MPQKTLTEGCLNQMPTSRMDKDTQLVEEYPIPREKAHTATQRKRHGSPPSHLWPSFHTRCRTAEINFCEKAFIDDGRRKEEKALKSDQNSEYLQNVHPNTTFTNDIMCIYIYMDMYIFIRNNI